MALCKESVSAMRTLTPSSQPTVYMRPLPFTLHALDSEIGRRHFGEGLIEGSMASYFRLAQQFHTQLSPIRKYPGASERVSVSERRFTDIDHDWILELIASGGSANRRSN